MFWPSFGNLLVIFCGFLKLLKCFSNPKYDPNHARPLKTESKVNFEMWVNFWRQNVQQIAATTIQRLQERGAWRGAYRLGHRAASGGIVELCPRRNSSQRTTLLHPLALADPRRQSTFFFSAVGGSRAGTRASWEELAGLPGRQAVGQHAAGRADAGAFSTPDPLSLHGEQASSRNCPLAGLSTEPARLLEFSRAR